MYSESLFFLAPWLWKLVAKPDSTGISLALADPRIERLLAVAQEMNDLVSKVQTATTYLAEIPEAEDFDAIYLSRTELGRNLIALANEARLMQPELDVIISKFKGQKREVEAKRQMSLGLAKIEGLGNEAKARDFSQTARQLEDRHKELENLIRALEALTEDLSTTRRSPINCPRCGSTTISYKISPSDFGFTLYECVKCAHAWKTTSFTIHLR
jgi:DNA-directed RNA polymerase subunit M/transcription elongation factor TFIIS